MLLTGEMKESVATFPAQALPWSGSTGLISAGPELTSTFFVKLRGKHPGKLIGFKTYQKPGQN
jgi:hypothetical protein